MKVVPLAADSLGARSMATLVETPDLTVLIDPSVRLAPYRYDLPPHEVEEDRMRDLWRVIREAAKKADILTVSHFHYDHHNPDAPSIYKGKRAFLKEVVRACQMESVEVRPERLEEFAERHLLPGLGTASLFHSATSRAVGGLDHLIPTALRVLKPGGHLCLWLGRQQSRALTEGIPGLAWRPAIPLPLSESREILVGVTGPGT